MSLKGSVIGSAASGIVTRAHHAHWDDVNPTLRQTKTREQQAQEASNHIRQQARLRRKVANKRVLPALCK